MKKRGTILLKIKHLKKEAKEKNLPKLLEV